MAFRARWVVSWLTLIADGLDLDRYISRTCYGVGVYYMSVKGTVDVNLKSIHKGTH